MRRLGASGNGRGIIKQATDWSNKAISAPRQSLYESWILSLIGQYFTQPLYRSVDAVVKINECVGRPELIAQFITRHRLTRMGEQQSQYLEGLLLDLQLDPILAKLARSKIEFEDSETICGSGLRCHGLRPWIARVYTVMAIARSASRLNRIVANSQSRWYSLYHLWELLLMFHRHRWEGPSVCSGSKPVHASSPGNDLIPLIRAAVTLVSLGWYALVPTPVLAQAVYGSIFGAVTDPFGAPVVGAKLTLTSVQKGTKSETTTNETGNYTFTHLIPDQYDVR